MRHLRSDVNRGLAWNQNRALDVAKGRYLVFLHHDDLMLDDYVRRCVEGLEQDPAVVLCYAQTSYIGASGELTTSPEHQIHAVSDSPSQRFKEVLRNKHQCEAMFGVMRTDVLSKTGVHGAYAGSEQVLLGEMAAPWSLQDDPGFPVQEAASC